MMFYTSVTAWILQYFVKIASGAFEGMDTSALGIEFETMRANPWMMLLFVGIVVVVGFLVCSFSLQGGLERVTKIMMIALLVIMVVLALNSFFLPGAAEGLKFYLIPDIGRANDIGWFNVIVGAMNQAFFTLSLGIGSMAIFGSYLKKDRALLGESVNVAVLDTFVAITSGLIIFPACFTYGVNPDSGPNLIFVTLPSIFNNIAFGRIWGSLFFIFLAFAALSTIFAVFENIISCVRDIFGWSRHKACLISGVAMFLLSLPCIFGFNILQNIQPFGEGSSIMDLEDFLVSNILLPGGSLIFAIFCTCRYGWGWKKFETEANEGKGLKVAKWMRPYFTYVIPVIVIFLFVAGLINFFK